MPKISVIMPVYNGEKYLREAIDSILTQTYPDFEFIIIDDGSTDSSPEIVRSYDDPRIRFVQNEHNMGVAATLNRGLDLAAGEYIARMDADDISLPERFAKQVEYMNAHPGVAVCGCGLRFMGAQWGERRFAPTPGQMKVDMLFSCGLAHPTVMMRGAVFGKDGLCYDERFSKLEDYALWEETIQEHEIACVSEILFQYRIHQGQVTQNYTDAFREQFRALKMRQMERLDLPNEGEGFEAFLLYCQGGSFSAEDVVRLADWLRQIRAANQRVGMYDSQLLDKSLNAVLSSVLNRYPLQQAVRLAGQCGRSGIVYAANRTARNGLARLRNAAATRRRQSRLRHKGSAAGAIVRCCHKDFTIISNNCWGGLVYQKYGLEYNTPTIGLGIRSGSEYVRFCKNLNTYLSKELVFIPWKESKYCTEQEMKSQVQYPVARLGDIEIRFTHYATEEEARKKWNRRKARINQNCIIFKLSQREYCTREDVEHFLALPLEHKICFAYDEVPGAIVIPELKDLKGDETPLVSTYFDELDYLNRL